MTVNIKTANLILHACMQEKRPNSTKINPRKSIPSKYTRSIRYVQILRMARNYVTYNMSWKLLGWSLSPLKHIDIDRSAFQNLILKLRESYGNIKRAILRL